MKLERAIEIMQTGPPESSSISDEDEEAAANIAIEAMKRLKEHREEHIDIGFRYLPGETTD